MPLWYKKALNLTEKEVRYAMKNSHSNKSAALFMRVSYPTWKKYAKMYFDAETGKSLFDLHKSTGRGIPKNTSGRYSHPDYLRDVLLGKHPEYKGKQLKKRLIKEGIFPEECGQCGFHERRVDDFTVPLVLVWKDGDKSNHLKENLLLICFNCYYLCYADFRKGNINRANFDK